jgi:hypothetical protein
MIPTTLQPFVALAPCASVPAGFTLSANRRKHYIWFHDFHPMVERFLLLILLFPVTLYSQQPSSTNVIFGMPAPEESSEFDVKNAELPFPELTPPKPFSILPVRKVSSFTITNRIDTLRIEFMFDSVASPRAFTYKPAWAEYGQKVAIQRKNDWVILDWREFKTTSPGVMEMAWIDLEGKGSLELMFSRDNSGEQILTSKTSPFTGTNYSTHSNWRKAKGFCILDVDALTFVVDGIYTGYEYFYEMDRYVSGPRNTGTGYHYPESYHTDRQRKTITLFYDFNIQPGEGIIKVRQTQCREVVVRDPSKQYIIQESKSELHAEKVEYDEPKCTPMYETGTYVLQNGQFVWKN